MQTMARLVEHQDTLLREIEVAARKRDASAVLDSMRKLETLVALMRRQQEIDQALLALKQGHTAMRSSTAGVTDARSEDDGSEPSSKERGRRQRDSFVRTLAGMGVRLQQSKGAVFTTPAGEAVGIAYAREGNKDRWFLGLPESIDLAVLLCEGHGGKLTHFSLPKEFMDQHKRALSRKNGQLKFNVLRRAGEFLLHLPRRGSVSIEAFRDNFSGLTRAF